MMCRMIQIKDNNFIIKNIFECLRYDRIIQNSSAAFTTLFSYADTNRTKGWRTWGGCIACLGMGECVADIWYGMGMREGVFKSCQNTKFIVSWVLTATGASAFGWRLRLDTYRRKKEWKKHAEKRNYKIQTLQELRMLSSVTLKDKEGYQQDFMKRGAIEVAWFC